MVFSKTSFLRTLKHFQENTCTGVHLTQAVGYGLQPTKKRRFLTNFTSFTCKDYLMEYSLPMSVCVIHIGTSTY